MRLGRVLILTVSLFTLGTASTLFSSGGASATAGDSARIVPWHQIGDVELGMSQRKVNDVYDSIHTLSDGEMSRYDVPGGNLYVWFARHEVVDLFTTSPRYRTPEGTGVGSRIPFGPCHRTARTSCERRWRGLVYWPGYDPKYGGGPGVWRGLFCYRGIRTVAQLPTKKGVVDEVGLFYDAGVCGRQAPRFPLAAADRAAITAAVLDRAPGGAARREATDVRVAIDTKRWASAWLNSKPRGAAQSAFFVLEHRGQTWVVLSYGTRGTGCSLVPIKPLTQIGGACGTSTSAP